MRILQGARSPERDRTAAYRDLARRIAAADVVALHPLALPPYERRLHVRRTLREDHQFRILNRPEGAQAKFDKLADDLYDFFRGTALLYYRDRAGTDGDLPYVVTLGDVHPENFGVMPNEDGAPVFGVNDFDEAAVAPFSYDVKRGAVGFWLAAKRNGHKKKARRAAVRAFVDGYLDGLAAFAQDDAEKWHEYRIDNSPDMIRELLEGAVQPRREFLAECVDVEKRRFRSSGEIVPHSKHREQFQEVIDRYVADNEVDVLDQRDGYFSVCDVAIKKGSGTASLGLDRFWVLVEGPDPDDPAEARILELKQARASALTGLVPPEAEGDGLGDAESVVRAQKVHLVGGDPFYGRAEIEGQAFLLRERSPFKDDVDVEDLDEDAMCVYADICGRALAQPHARSDADTGRMEADAEKAILEAVHPAVFTADMVLFAEAAARRVKRDWQHFKEDHAHGAFDFSHVE